MLKMLDKTNIDFVGPRYYCMAGSVILIVLGLWSRRSARWQGMFNIDFTGGTLVTIRLNENDPSVKPLSESQRAATGSAEGERLARRDGREPADEQTTRAWRDSTSARPTRDLDKVKNEILEAFGSSLARVEMTVTEGKPIARQPPSPPAGDAAKTAAALATARFAGGREYELTFNTTAFNSTQTPAQVDLGRVRQGSRGRQDRQSPSHVSRSSTDVDRPEAETAGRRSGTKLILAHRSRARRRQDHARRAQGQRWPTTPTCSSSGSPISAARSPARPARSP